MQLLGFTLAVAAYFILHSLLAADSVKQFFFKKLISERWYRLVFNFLSVLLLLPLAYFFFVLEKQILIENDWVMVPGGLLTLAGLVWLLRAMRGYDMGEFLGTYQLENGKQPEHTLLNIKGLNAQVRHPLYFGTLLVICGVFFLVPNDAALVIALVSTLYLVVGSKLEEQKLEQQFGEAYRSYQRDVPMLIPFRWKRRRK